MIDENEGYAGGGSGFVYRTIDGGDNWNFHGSIATTLTDIDFASDTQGYACGDGGAVFSITPQGVTNLNSGQPHFFSGISLPLLIMFGFVVEMPCYVSTMVQLLLSSLVLLARYNDIFLL